MSVKLEKFVRKQFPVEAVQVTAENMEEIAKWCKGTIESTDSSIAEQLNKPVQTWIRIDTLKPIDDRQTQAFVGDWVVVFNRGYKIYKNNAMNNSFDKVAEEKVKDVPKPTDPRTSTVHKSVFESIGHTPAPEDQQAIGISEDLQVDGPTPDVEKFQDVREQYQVKKRS